MAAFRALDPDKKHHRTIIARRADSRRPHYVFVSRYRLFVIGSQHIAGIRTKCICAHAKHVNDWYSSESSVGSSATKRPVFGQR
jgi:hypothetical protein